MWVGTRALGDTVVGRVSLSERCADEFLLISLYSMNSLNNHTKPPSLVLECQPDLDMAGCAFDATCGNDAVLHGGTMWFDTRNDATTHWMYSLVVGRWSQRP